MKKTIRALSLALAFLFVLGLLPIGELSCVKTAEAANDVISCEDAEKVITEIWNQTKEAGKKYWNAFYKGIGKSNNAELKNAADTKNYASAFTNKKHDKSNAQEDKNHQYDHGFCNSNTFYGCQQCRGFAKWVTYCIFKDKLFNYKYGDGWTKIPYNKVGNYSFKSGDFVCLKGSSAGSHYVVVWSVINRGASNEKIKIIECNHDGRCGIGTRTIDRSVFIDLITDGKAGFVASSPTVLCLHKNLDENGDCTTPNCNYHAHAWDDYGHCKKDGFDYYSQANISSAANGVASPRSGESFYVYTKPFTKSDKVQVKGFSGDYIDLSVNRATIVSRIKNHLGNEWYQLEVEVGGVSSAVYVSADDVTVQWKSKIVITGVVYPKDQSVAKKNQSVIGKVEGKVTTSGSTISAVTAAVYRKDKLTQTEIDNLYGNKYTAADALALAKKSAECSGSKTGIGKDSFNLHSFYSNLTFSSLPGGVSYLYVVTVTDSNGVNACSPHSFYLKTSSSAKNKYSVILNTNGSVTMHTVAQGSSITLPAKSREGYAFLGWAESSDAAVEKYAPSTNFQPSRSITLYSVFREINPPAAPVLTAQSYDIAEGATQMISWNVAAGATKYTARVYDADGTKVYEQSSAGTTAVIPFENAGTYSVKVEAFNSSLAGGSGESEQSVTVHVHGPSTVTFLNHDGSVYSTQQVPYGGTADTPTSPSRAGYSFSRWEGSMTQVFEDTSLIAVYTPIRYKVTFCDENGNAIDTQYVTYDGDTPGSAIEPQAPAKANYTFVGWNTGAWEHVTESGIKVYPVYVWANEDVPLAIDITSVTPAGDGYWVYYTVTNHMSSAQLGRVVIAGKTTLGKFITQTESGAFYLTGGDGTSYQGNAYVPVNSSDMQTLATVEAYVVDSYITKNPIAEPDAYIIGSVNGEYSAWMTADELAVFTAPYTSMEEATQYSIRTKSTYTTTASPYLDWEVESFTTQEGEWGNWSDWQDTEVTATDRIEVETRQVEVSAAHTEYRYGRWYASSAVGAQSGNTFKPAVSPAFAHANYNYKNASSLFSKNYSAWSTTRYKADSSTFKTTYHDSDQTYYQKSGSYYYWHIYYLGSSSTANKYFWEESRTVPAQYKTQYRYRIKADDITTYTYYHWSDWSEYSFTPATAAADREAQTRTVYRVKLSNATQGSTYTFSGELGPFAAGKQAILNVYKVDAASDYSNQYIEQVTLGANGAYSFSFDTLETPSVRTGDYTVSLTIAGGTESLYIGTITAPKPQYTVQFVDEVTGQALGEQTVAEGSAAVAPTVPEHEGYYFLGWEYGLGNIREDMVIQARFVKRGYTVVFVDDVRMSISMANDIPYATPVIAPEVTAPEGYIFIGWEAPEGMSLNAVTEHMIVIAKYEQITNQVSFLDADGLEIARQTVGYGEYAEDPFTYEGDLFFFDDDDDEDQATNLMSLRGGATIMNLGSFRTLNDGNETSSNNTSITEGDLNIPDSMYFVGWSEGAEDPVTQTLTLMPILSYIEDVDEVETTLDGGIYVGEQTTTLETNGSIAGLVVLYRINTVGGVEGEWSEYDLENAPDIAITETCVLEIEASAENKNSFTASYEYVIVSAADQLPAPANITATQNDVESVIVNWSSVNGANGYMVKRTSDCDETAEFDVGTAMSFIDYGVDALRTYTYQVFAYSMIERSGSSLMLEGNGSTEAEVFFYGDNTLVSTVAITAPATVYEGSATQLSATVAPVDAYDSSVSWICTDGTGEGYVTSDGLFYGITPGTVNVTAKALDGSNQSDTVTITVQEIVMGENHTTITVSSAQVRAGGTANVSVSISENSLADKVQFALLYDSAKLTLTAFDAGEAMQGLAPTISNPSEGVVLFVWESLTSLTAEGSMLDLTFAVKADASGTALVEIPTDGSEYDFIFAHGNDAATITVASVNGMLDIASLLLGDVDESGGVNVIDANMIRRYAARLMDLSNTQLLAADVNGDGKVNVIDANLIRRYVAHLISVFPADSN